MCTTLSPNATSRVKLSVLRCVLGALAGVFMISWQASEAANLNLSALKSSHTYTPYAGEPLERIIAKTMPNSPLKTELLGQAFRSLNPQQFSSATSNLVKTNNALKVPNHNQLADLVLSQMEEERATQNEAKSKPTNNASSSPKSANIAVAASAPLARVPGKTESWVRFPRANAPVAVKAENWVRYPSIAASLDSVGMDAAVDRSHWVRYISGPVTAVISNALTRVDNPQWVRYPSSNAVNVASASKATVDQSQWVRYPLESSDSSFK
ncbi:MAG: hypothetical protein NT035_14210 [Burkholderiales bacterium]|nr:hypothetical protein [Burkholderiales bacterium]